MKKFGIGLALILMVTFLAACGSDESGAIDENSDEDQENQAEKTDSQTDEQAETSVEVKDKSFKRYSQYGGDGDTVGIFAELKNEGDTPVSLPNIEISFLDDDDNILEVADSQDTATEGSLMSPTIIKSGGSGYISLDLDYEEKYDDLDHVDIDYDAEPVDDVNTLDVDKINFTGELDDYPGKDSETTESNVDVTFNLKNNDDKGYDYQVGAGLYNKDNELIGALVDLDYTDVDYAVKANSDRNIEISEILPVNMDDVDHADVEAIGIENTVN